MPHDAPQLSGEVHIREDREALLDDLGMALLGAAGRAVDERGEFHLALSGGSTPERFYMQLVIDPRFRDIPWKQTHIWLVDERRVPVDDERSNFRMIREALTDHLPLRRRQVHPVPVTDNDPAAAYEREMRDVFERDRGDAPPLDFVLLGMGDDCHTASLFPHSPALSARGRWIANNEGEHVTPPARVTMTFDLLNAARELAVLVTGEKKADAIRRVADQLKRGPDVTSMPITGVTPDDGELTWYLDAAAAGEESA